MNGLVAVRAQPIASSPSPSERPNPQRVTVRVETDAQRIGMGRSVSIRATAKLPGDRPAAGYLLLPYVNGKRWGAHEYADAQGRATMILPLPNPGLAEVSVEAVSVSNAAAIASANKDSAQQPPVGTGPSAGLPLENLTLEKLPRLLTGAAAPADANLSKPVTVRVDRRKLQTLPTDPEHLVIAQYCSLYSPQWFTWSTAQAVPLLGFYQSWNTDVLRQHVIWLAESGVDVLLVDWSNQLWGRKHWDERLDNANEVVHSTTMLLETLASMRDEGLPVPQAAIFVGVMNGASTTVTAFNETSEWIYHNYIRNPRFHGLFLQYLGKPLLLEFNGGGPEWLKKTGQVAVDERHFTIRGMSAQHQANHHNELGYWTWMDGALRQPVTLFNGKPEAMTASVAFFDGEGWKGRTAFGRRGGWTYVESFRQALEQRPRFLQLHQFQEFCGAAEDPQVKFYGDSYSVELSDDMEPVSPTCPAYRGNGGWGFFYLNLTRALIDLYRQPTPETTVVVVERPDRRQIVQENRLAVRWTWLGKQPQGFSILLNGKTLADNVQGKEATVDLSGIADGPAVLRLTARGTQARYELAYGTDSIPNKSMTPASVEVDFILRRGK